MNNSALILRLATLTAAVVVVVAGACVATAAVHSTDRRWWVAVGGFVVALSMVGVGYTLALSALHYWGY